MRDENKYASRTDAYMRYRYGAPYTATGKVLLTERWRYVILASDVMQYLWPAVSSVRSNAHAIYELGIYIYISLLCLSALVR